MIFLQYRGLSSCSELSKLPPLQDNQPTPPSLEILLLFSFVDHGRTQNEIGIKKAGQSKKSANLFMKLETIKNTQDSGTASQLDTEINRLTPSCHSSLFPKKKQPLNQRFLSLICKAMEANHVKRLVDWGTPSVHFEQDKKSLITVFPGIIAGILFSQAKKEMLKIAKVLQESDLDWTLVRFMAPQNTGYTGNVKVGFGDTKMKFSISREDIGAFMIKMLESDTYIRSMPIIGS